MVFLLTPMFGSAEVWRRDSDLPIVRAGAV